MDNGYKTLIQIKRENEARRHLKYKTDSKDRLKKIACKKIETTMIGALDTIEKKLGFLWAADDNGKLSNTARQLKELYSQIRQEILDRGNTQIRNLNTEIDQYDVEWLRYNLVLPVNRSKPDEK